MHFSLPQFLAYEGASGDFPVSKGPPTVPLTQILCHAVFFKSQNLRKVGTLCSKIPLILKNKFIFKKISAVEENLYV